VGPPPCTTVNSCRAAPSPQPQIFGAPPSATFSGVGNLVPPRRHRKRGHKARRSKAKRNRSARTGRSTGGVR
jgi:hypothetical protein